MNDYIAECRDCGQQLINKRSEVYTIPGEPIPLLRPRFSGRHVYDSQTHAKTAAAIYLIAQHGNKPKFAGPLHFAVEFWMKAPKDRRKLRTDLFGEFMTSRPDLSNLLKFVEDVSQNAGIFSDDCIIADIKARKRYGPEPKTVFIITEMK